MKMASDELWRQIVLRLEAAYSVGGREALGKMNPVEFHVLYAEKHVALRKASNWMANYPADELGAIRLQKLEGEVTDIASWLKEKQQEAREHGRDRGPER
jgi:hypothetical protein